ARVGASAPWQTPGAAKRRASCCPAHALPCRLFLCPAPASATLGIRQASAVGRDGGMALLETRNLTRRFGGLLAVNDLSFTVEASTIHGLIGPNGAGKTTTFNVISGFYAPTSGQVFY